jgi:hypothetical protein
LINIFFKKFELVKACLLIIYLFSSPLIFSQEKNQIKYFQMEPLDDSLFIHIQQQVYISPPDPKAEIIVDLRDPNNQTVSIKGTLYPFLAFNPETRAKIMVYPFKINLEQQVNYGSIFTEVLSKINLSKIISLPSPYQISSTMSYINPFLQAFGGERVGVGIKSDIGFSFGIGTPYSGPLETNWVEANFNMLGMNIGAYSSADGLTDFVESDRFNNLYVTGLGYQLGYIIPLGNFFKITFTGVLKTPSKYTVQKYIGKDTLVSKPKVISNDYFNWEFRYPIRVLGSTRAKFYVADFLDEWHFGFTGRELSLAGSVFDLRLDAMPKSDVRNPQYLIEILIQKIFGNWGASAFAIGPSIIFSKTASSNLGILRLFVNLRLKLGTSL